MRRRVYRKKLKFRLKKETIYTIVTVFLLASSLLIILSFFSTHPFLSLVAEKTMSLFGWSGFLVPVFLTLLALLLVKVRPKWLSINLFVGFSLTWLSLLGLTKAGVLGLSVWENIEIFLSGIGAFLLLTGGFLIGLVVFFNTSLEEILDKLGLLVKFVMGIFSRSKNLVNFKKEKPIFVPDLSKTKIPAPSMSPKTSVGKFPSGQSAFQPMLSTPSLNKIWEYPPLTLLSEIPGQKADRGDIKTNAQIIERTLESFGIAARVVEVNKGPAVTQYALEIAMGTKLSKITALQNDLALALAAPTGQIRIEAPIPGKSLVGVEIPNRSLEFVTLKTMLSSEVLKNHKSKLAVALGLNVSGNPIVADIAKMPHVLIAGTTGSGKSVLINSWIASLLFRTTPEEVRLILVDPKRVELTGYNGIPHLLTPVIVEPEKILSALKWAMKEMDDRYRRFAEVKVRNIEGYNTLAGIQTMPYIIIFIDELADLMAFASVEVEDSVCRIAQMARATGIHLVLSTQRPSVDVITGLIKANIPCRIAFNVSSMIDSRVILDQPGAEKLLGRGDMLYIPPDQAKPTRIQGTYVSEKEVSDLVNFLRTKNVPVEYTEEVTSQTVMIRKPGGITVMGTEGEKDSFYGQAVDLVLQHKLASASFLQRKLSIGFSRAARIMDQLEANGIIGPAEGSKPREVLISSRDQILSEQEEA